ncbi:MAG: hypothetical protein IPF53_06820 [Blastocatellia bacterium]|nr:hypothetical protein [Blastocatellia bacterium]
MRMISMLFFRAGVALGVLFAVVAAPDSNVMARDARPAPALTVASVSWMVGNWETEPGRVQTDERWSPIAGGMMMGTSRTVAGERTVFFEFLRIETRPDGVFYVAQPKGRHPGVDFKLVRATDQEAVFENLAHDFPKRIIYRKSTDGSLTARIEGDGTEKEKPQEFRYRSAGR